MRGKRKRKRVRVLEISESFVRERILSASADRTLALARSPLTLSSSSPRLTRLHPLQIGAHHGRRTHHYWSPVSPVTAPGTESGSHRRHASTRSALQGSFAEHIASINSLSSSHNVRAVPVRTPSELERCKGLVIPGGESTAISLLITKSGLYEPLREFVRNAKANQGKSIWGTCAGMILLAKEIEGPTSEGWQGLDAIDVRVGRNSYGRQVSSRCCSRIRRERLLTTRETAAILLASSPTVLSASRLGPVTRHVHPSTSARRDPRL